MTARTVEARRVPRRGRARGAVTLAVTAVALAGCSPTSGAAAVVEGEAISVAEVHEATRQLQPYLQDAGPSSVLLLLIAEPTFERVARENGLGVSESEARALLDQLAAGAPGDDAQGGDAAGGTTEFGPGALSVARFTVLQQRLQELPDAAAVLEEVSAELAELDVEVNPRYGEVDFSEGTGLTPVEHPWLVAADTP